MSAESVETHDHPERRERASGQEKTYIAEKLRGAAVMYGPSVVLDLFEGISVLAAAFGRLPDPRRSTAARVLRPIMAGGVLAPWVYLLIVRPWHMNWGATDEEVRKRLPGDELVPHPMLESTRALTIRAPSEEVWRWLVQLGQDRGGFYSYDRLENLAAADIHNVDRVVPEMQHLKVGDFVPMAPVEWSVPMGGFTVVGIEPGRAIVWRQGWPEDVASLGPRDATSRSTWAFVLEEVNGTTSRLILRERSGRKPGVHDVVLNYLLLERQHFVMVRRMLLGIKERAERAYRQRADDAAGHSLEGTLLDEVMPTCEFRGRETVRVDASPGDAIAAFRELTLTEATPPPVKSLVSLRYLPGRLLGRVPDDESGDGSRPFVEVLADTGNRVLTEDPDREIVIGAIGRFHNMLVQHPASISGRKEFARFKDPAYQKLAMGVRAEEAEDGACDLTFEHRTHALSQASRRKFALYWWLMIKPGSALMARMLLRAIKRRAEDASR